MSNTIIYERFAEISRKFPELTAILEADRSWTYEQLERRMNPAAEHSMKATNDSILLLTINRFYKAAF